MNPVVRYAVAVCAALATIFVAVYFVLILGPSQEREVVAACNGMRPAFQNKAYARPCDDDPKRVCTFPARAKDFTVVDTQNQPVKLSDYRGKVVLVNFWASWCSVCRSEKPGLETMQRDLRDRGVEVLALASDREWGAVNGALDLNGTSLKVLLDPPDDDGNLGAVAKQYGITAVPETFVVDKQGVVRHYMINKRDWDSTVARTCIESLINE